MPDPEVPHAAPPAEVEGWKRRAAERAVEDVSRGMVLGLGTGSTVAHFLDVLGERIARGALADLVGVPSSRRTEAAATAVGLRLGTLARHPRLDLTVDGADEVSPRLDLIKGMGGALLREKMIAQASDRFVVIADEQKAVSSLGTRSPLPLEVVPWGWEAHAALLETRGARAELRLDDAGAPYRTDNGNLLLECRFPDGIDDPEALEAELRGRAGIVETGFFLGMADAVVFAGAAGTRVVTRGPR